MLSSAGNTGKLRGILNIIPHFTANSRYGTDVCNQCRNRLHCACTTSGE